MHIVNKIIQGITAGSKIFPGDPLEKRFAVFHIARRSWVVAKKEASLYIHAHNNYIAH